MPRRPRRPSAGGKKQQKRKERAAQKAIMRASGMSEAKYKELIGKYTHAGLWQGFEAGVAELAPRWEQQQEHQPNVAWQILAWLYLKIRKARATLEQVIHQVEAEKR